MKYWKEPGLLLTLGLILFLSLLLGFAELREEGVVKISIPQETLVLEEDAVPLSPMEYTIH